MVKQSTIVVQQPKIIEQPNFVDIKAVFIEHPKTSYKLPETIKQAKKVVISKNLSNSLFNETKSKRIFLE